MTDLRSSIRRRLGTAALVVTVAAGTLAAAARMERNHAAAVTNSVAANAAAPAVLPALAQGFAPIVKRAVPAVVNVSSTHVVRASQEDSQNSPFNDPFFRRFFGPGLRPDVPADRREHALGSGVIISPNGRILTNNHVVDGATSVKVSLSDKREYTAKVVGRDPKTDIAVLKIDANNLPYLPEGDSAKLQAGDIVLAIGNPFGLNQTVTMGIVSATGRSGLGIEDYEDFIQTDAAINPGNSGGALIDSRGELVGINTAILSGGSGGNQGVGFAVPINLARQVSDQISEKGHVVRGYLGAYVQDVTPAMARAWNLGSSNGAVLGDVEPGTPAAKAGLVSGDVVTTLNGNPVTDARSLRLQISMMQPGSRVTLGVVHDGKTREVPVALGEMPKDQNSPNAGATRESGVLNGITVNNVTPDVAQDLGLPANTHGVVVTRLSDASAAAAAGLQQNDVILEVNRKPVANVSEFERAAREAGNQAAVLKVDRNGTTLFLAVEPQ